METLALDAALPALGHTLAQRLGPGVGVSVSDLQAGSGALYPDEQTAVARAVPKRQREFAAGRLNARRAMAQLGEPPRSVPCGLDRAPVWPAHLVGSISHTDDACVAVVGFKHTVGALGIDLETDRGLEPDLWASIATPAELCVAGGLPAERRARWMLRLFSAKEAVYKWQYPLSGRLLDFHDVDISGLGTDPESPFVARLPGMPWLLPPAGVSLQCSGRVVSWVAGL